MGKNKKVHHDELKQIVKSDSIDDKIKDFIMRLLSQGIMARQIDLIMQSKNVNLKTFFIQEMFKKNEILRVWQEKNAVKITYTAHMKRRSFILSRVTDFEKLKNFTTENISGFAICIAQCIINASSIKQIIDFFSCLTIKKNKCFYDPQNPSHDMNKEILCGNIFLILVKVNFDALDNEIACLTNKDLIRLKTRLTKTASILVNNDFAKSLSLTNPHYQTENIFEQADKASLVSFWFHFIRAYSEKKLVMSNNDGGLSKMFSFVSYFFMISEDSGVLQFFSLVSRLPIEIQLKIANFIVDESMNEILPETSTAYKRGVAMVQIMRYFY